MAKKFNGTTAVLNSVALGKIIDVSQMNRGQEIDVTGSEDTYEVSEMGTIKRGAEITALGDEQWDPGDTGAFLLTWNSGGSLSLTLGLCIAAEPAGSLNGAVATKYSVVETE